MSVSIDIGTSEVKIIELSNVNDSAAISKISSISTWANSDSFDPEKLEKANWVACVMDACTQLKITPKKIKSVVAAISGKNVSVKEIVTLNMSEDELFQSLEFEAKKHIPLDGTEAVMDYHIKGNNGSEIDKIDVLLVATTKNIIKQFDSIVRESGFKNAVFDAEPIALANCLIHNYGESEDGIDIILDIGSSSSTLVVFGKEHTFFTRQIDIAGFHITKELMKKFDTDYRDADKILLEDGIKSLSLENQNETNDAFSLEVAEKTIISTMIDEVRKSLRYYVKSNNGDSNFKRLFISGGYSNLNGLKEMFEDELKLETELLNPFNNISSDMKIDHPSRYSVAVGLALRGLL